MPGKLHLSFVNVWHCVMFMMVPSHNCANFSIFFMSHSSFLKLESWSHLWGRLYIPQKKKQHSFTTINHQHFSKITQSINKILLALIRKALKLKHRYFTIKSNDVVKIQPPIHVTIFLFKRLFYSTSRYKLQLQNTHKTNLQNPAQNDSVHTYFYLHEGPPFHKIPRPPLLY